MRKPQSMEKFIISQDSTGKAKNVSQLEFLKAKKKPGIMVSNFVKSFTMRKEIVLLKNKRKKREKHLIGFLSNSTMNVFILPIQKLILQFSGHLLKSSDKSLVYFVFF